MYLYVCVCADCFDFMQMQSFHLFQTLTNKAQQTFCVFMSLSSAASTCCFVNGGRNTSPGIYLHNSEGNQMLVPLSLFKWGKRAALEMKASEEMDVFGFDLCLPRSPVLLKGFKAVISGIMVCYVVSGRGAHRCADFFYLFHQSNVIQSRAERPKERDGYRCSC